MNPLNTNSTSSTNSINNSSGVQKRSTNTSSMKAGESITGPKNTSGKNVGGSNSEKGSKKPTKLDNFLKTVSIRSATPKNNNPAISNLKAALGNSTADNDNFIKNFKGMFKDVSVFKNPEVVAAIKQNKNELTIRLESCLSKLGREGDKSTIMQLAYVCLEHGVPLSEGHINTLNRNASQFLDAGILKNIERDNPYFKPLE
ncbi:MAG TPA: hypothetical protein VGP47_07255, partial [Parachlamydiaceae bacterium]|nr:hypothetical protein [Parachlamydiaceae bacterium]